MPSAAKRAAHEPALSALSAHLDTPRPLQASKLQGLDWGSASPLARADFAYPRSGGMRPTIFRFLPADDANVPPTAAAVAADVQWSARNHPTAGSGWYSLREGVSVVSAFAAFARLASRRWASVELYNCRSFARELFAELVADGAKVEEALDNVFRLVVLERERHGDRAHG